MSDARWWIEAEGRIWGPYPPGRLRTFREEGRLGASTLVAEGRDGPFTPAALEPGLSDLFRDEAAPRPLDAAPTPTPAERTLLVLGPAEATEGFEAALGGHGPWACVGPGAWLLRARESPAALRNALSRRVRDGVLLVVEAPLEAAAWFNLPGEADRALRRLWAGPAKVETT